MTKNKIGTKIGQTKGVVADISAEDLAKVAGGKRHSHGSHHKHGGKMHVAENMRNHKESGEGG